MCMITNCNTHNFQQQFLGSKNIFAVFLKGPGLVKTFNLYSGDKDSESCAKSKPFPQPDTAFITCKHSYHTSMKQQKIIRTNEVFLSTHHCSQTHIHTQMSINLFRLVVGFNYYYQPFSSFNNSWRVCSCSCQKQAETISSESRETNSVYGFSLALPLCSVKAFNQALVYFLFVYYVIV